MRNRRDVERNKMGKKAGRNGRESNGWKFY